DQVVQIAQSLQIGAELVTGQGLKLLTTKKPEEVPGAITDLQSIVEIAPKYSDGQVSVSDVTFTVTTVLNRLNARFGLVEGEGTEYILASLNAVSRIVEIYFTEASLPSEFGIYVNALAVGVQDGLDAYYETLTVVPAGSIGGIPIAPHAVVFGQVMP
ncbi:MAG: hypothetical protein ACREN0_11765, partial [Thermodesulfobacteriota bacterium]